MKKLQIIFISIAFLLIIFAKTSFSVDTNENKIDSKLSLLQQINTVIKAEESLGNNHEKVLELKKAREQYSDTLENIELMRNKIAVLKEMIEEQKNHQNSVSAKREAQSVYTIQTGSFIDVERAIKEFDLLIKALNEEDSSYLRIEKVGKFYSVRVGRFNDYTNAKRFLLATESQLNMAIIIKTFIKGDRIIRSQKDFILSAR